MSVLERRTITFRKNCPTVVTPAEINKIQGGFPNRIKTTRYTLITWLPKSLFAQFCRAANIYFLIVCIAVCIPNGPMMWQSTVLTFAAVILWTALKDMYEDKRRERDDDAENSRGQCRRYDTVRKCFEEVRWDQVVAGDLLLNFADEAFPADVLLVRPSGGQAFISTVNLDGETNLKERRAVDLLSALADMPEAGAEVSRTESKDAVMSMAKQSAELLLSEGLKVDLDMPHSVLTDMEGSVELSCMSENASAKLKATEVKQPCKLNYEVFVPRGCVLRNTKYVLSIAAYCGPHTKTRLNASVPVAKVSNMQKYLNRGVTALVSSLFVFCLYCAIRAYAEGIDEIDDSNPAIRFVYYWIILYQIVPISLYVCFEIIKLALGFQINTDPQMLCPRTKLKAMARTADLVEEMGQVNFIFSDKTGTLTENEMVFARCCVSGYDFGDFRGTDRPGVMEVRNILSDNAHAQHKNVLWFMFSLATNHSVQVQVDEAGCSKFEGSSADEVAFVEAAAACGIIFTSRSRLPGTASYEVVVTGPGVKDNKFIQRCEIPFSSERKRMSVLIEYNGDHWLMSKGADNVMSGLCDRALDSKTTENLTQYSKEGLRTLVIAAKKMEEHFAKEWLQRWNAGLVASEGKEKLLEELAAEVEHSLEPLGVTSIEDKLQAGVPEAIETIKKADIRFWVLTGDKTETAVEIVKACRLFTEHMVLASMVNCRDEEHALELLEDAKRQLDTQSEGGLVLDGTFALHVLRSERARPVLYELAMKSKACVCCRLSPEQKRKLVELVKAENRDGITLAIGDGANDVPMIQGAHVGIGIRGKEGNQAVQASDVAISQFRFLVPLLFCHGRRAYRRVATFLCYMFYKHTTLAVGDVFWAHQISFRAQIAYPEWLNSAYAALICGIPVIIVLSLDRDIPDEVSIAEPDLYTEGIQRLRFNGPLLAFWVLSAFYHGGIAWLVPNLTVGSTDWETDEFWYASCCSFILVVVFVDSRLWMVSESPFSKETLGILLFSILVLIATMCILAETSLGESFQPQIKGAVTAIFSGDYITVVLLTPLVLLIELAGYQIIAVINPYPLTATKRRLRWGSTSVVKTLT
eukprot:TRINITY_DN91944_c0_g1_i1.p1 TRINITY_DN91944_c0_g1~~TRINITY_DN91944_c0_g1_i1.p1  ORF type:complete len:1091 (-),score=194.42 TRINITY_DN91944_c0_g1_i1:2-3274(-)